MKYIVTFILILVLKTGNTQTIYGKADWWNQFTIDYSFGTKWTVGSEFHYRLNDWTKKEQLLVRPYAVYHYKPWLDLAGGLTYILTYPYDAYPLPSNRPEYNIWEQAMIKQPAGKWTILHRFRLEQRLISTLDTNSNTFNFDEGLWIHRYRYRFTALAPIAKNLKAQFFNEIFLHAGRQTLFDRNWFSLGLVYQIHPNTNIQFCYLNQYAFKNFNLYEKHHGLLVMLFWNL